MERKQTLYLTVHNMAPNHGLQAHTIISTRVKATTRPTLVEIQASATAQLVLYITTENRAMPRLPQSKIALYIGRVMEQKARLCSLRDNPLKLAHR